MTVSQDFRFARAILELQRGPLKMAPSAPSAQDVGLPSTEQEIQALTLVEITRCPPFIPKAEAQPNNASSALSGAREISATATLYDYFLIMVTMIGFCMAVSTPFLMPLFTASLWLQTSVVTTVVYAWLGLTLWSVAACHDRHAARLQQA